MSNQTQPTHTPGPWRTMSWGETISIDAKVEGEWHLGLAHINPHGNHNAGIASAQDRANARLIAAAPELLAVVKNLMACMDAEPEVYHPAFIASTRAALAKAKGE